MTNALSPEDTTVESPSDPLADFPVLPRRQTFVELPSGEIRIEAGADGAYLIFDADCKDALPYCKAQCCRLIGTYAQVEEVHEFGYDTEFNPADNTFELHRDADGACTYLDREKCACGIYDIRPATCRAFHCSRGPGMRGWKLANHVDRQSMF